jgi:hypothetical protein
MRFEVGDWHAIVTGKPFRLVATEKGMKDYKRAESGENEQLPPLPDSPGMTLTHRLLETKFTEHPIYDRAYRGWFFLHLFLGKKGERNRL